MHTAFADGRLSYSKVRALTRVATADREEELLSVALSATAAQVVLRVRTIRHIDRHTGETDLWRHVPSNIADAVNLALLCQQFSFHRTGGSVIETALATHTPNSCQPDTTIAPDAVEPVGGGRRNTAGCVQPSLERGQRLALNGLRAVDEVISA